MTYGGFLTLTLSQLHCSSQQSPSTAAYLPTPSTVPVATPLQESIAMGCPQGSVGGGGNCHLKCVLGATALVLGGAAIGYFVAQKFASRRLNCKHQLGCDKVVDTIDMEDIGEKKALCRCWQSDKFPYCDGSHNKHNKETGDNLGPLIIQGKKQ